ncbi:alpha-2,8-sialyltransferase 8E-like [Vanacampus margaritifer]
MIRRRRDLVFSFIFFLIIIVMIGRDYYRSKVSLPKQIPPDPAADVCSNLSSCTHGVEMAIITQENTPVGTVIHYLDDWMLTVTPDIFKTFVKKHPFSTEMYDKCAVVGSGGILIDSGCGETIDSAQFVIRCNLPPLNHVYAKDVGFKTDLVTANLDVFERRYESLSGLGPQQKLVEAVQIYGKALMLLHTFSYRSYTQVSMRAARTLKDFKSPIRAISFNPNYVRNVSRFWAAKGLAGYQPTTGILMASLALELCSEVHLYGFWPFDKHPDGHTLTKHYYNDLKHLAVHDMPIEFGLLSTLNKQGVLRLHTEACPAKERV